MKSRLAQSLMQSLHVWSIAAALAVAVRLSGIFTPAGAPTFGEDALLYIWAFQALAIPPFVALRNWLGEIEDNG